MTRPEPIEPGPEQESVWDYPRPPALEAVEREIVVIFADEEIARTTAAFRVLETSHPPVYYLPPDDIQIDCLTPGGATSFCEYKGRAEYLDVEVGDRRVEKAAWRYPEPTERFEPIANHVAFYAQKMDSCYVGGEQVRPQPGEFYGGWITSDVVGPFKGVPGSAFW